MYTKQIQRTANGNLAKERNSESFQIFRRSKLGDMTQTVEDLRTASQTTVSRAGIICT